jgi:hypothetical protein
MNRSLLLALVMGGFVVLTSFAVATRSPNAPAVVGPAWTVSQYQLDRAFRFEMTQFGLPVSLPMPAGGGLIITQLKLSGSAGASITVSVNGVAERFDFGVNYSSPSVTAPLVHELNPPIIVRPGQVMTVTENGAYGGARYSFAGYTTLPGET